MAPSNRIIIGINKITGKLVELSTKVTLKEVLRYLNSEYQLNKQIPGGLYDEYHKIKVIMSDNVRNLK